jgi:outer membrane protein assembly factor BamB
MPSHEASTPGSCHAATLVAIATIPFLFLPAHAADWPQYRGPTRDGKTTEQIMHWPPTNTWTRTVGAGFAEASVVGDRLYTEGYSETGGGKNTLWCLDAWSGEVIWSTSYSSGPGFAPYPGPRATPTVTGGHVYTFSPDGGLRRFDAATGAMTLIDTLATGIPDFGAASSPLIVDGRLFLNAGGYAGVAYDVVTGTRLWPPAFSGTASHASPIYLTWNGQDIVAFFANDRLTGRDPATGAERFTYPFTGVPTNTADPIQSGNHIFISASYGRGCARLNMGTGTLTLDWYKGNTDLDDGIRNEQNGSILHDGYLYGINAAGDLRCVDFGTGLAVWRQGLIGTESSIVMADGEFLVLSNLSKDLIRVQPTPSAYIETGRFHTASSDDLFTAPTLAHGQIFVRSNNVPGQLTCYALYYTLSVAATGGGSVDALDGSTHDPGTTLTVTATPSAGTVFDGWDGDLSGRQPVRDVVMSRPRSIVAAFAEDADADGMADYWEDAYDLDSSDPADAAGDPDLDGLTNLDEYLADSDPLRDNNASDSGCAPGTSSPLWVAALAFVLVLRAIGFGNVRVETDSEPVS